LQLVNSWPVHSLCVCVHRSTALHGSSDPVAAVVGMDLSMKFLCATSTTSGTRFFVVCLQAIWCFNTRNLISKVEQIVIENSNPFKSFVFAVSILNFVRSDKYV
jgi:hypothetical protein